MSGELIRKRIGFAILYEPEAFFPDYA